MSPKTDNSLGGWEKCEVLLRFPFRNEGLIMPAASRAASKVILGCQLCSGITSSAESYLPQGHTPIMEPLAAID